MKKDFDNNPAYDMLSGYTESENKNIEIVKAPVQTESKKTFEPIVKEKKSKKILLGLKPSVYDKLQAKAKDYNISLTELINQILETNV